MLQDEKNEGLQMIKSVQDHRGRAKLEPEPKSLSFQSNVLFTWIHEFVSEAPNPLSESIGTRYQP